MTFTWPIFLFGLLLVPALVALYVWVQRRRQRFVVSHSNVALIAAAAGAGATWRRHVPATLYLLAIAAMIVGLARPATTVPVTKTSGTIILVLDVSRSMSATDVKPSRIEAAQAVLRDFVNKQPRGIEIGLVAFAGSPLLVTPPTEDRKQLLEAMNLLRLERATNIGGGLQMALDVIVDPDGEMLTVAPRSGTPPPAVVANPESVTIILLSDGRSTTGPPALDVARAVALTGVKTYTVGLGNRQAQGGGFMQPDIAMLQAIAAETGGKYYDAQSSSQLEDIYDELAKQREIVFERSEVTFIAAGLAALLMGVSGALGLLWFNKLP